MVKSSGRLAASRWKKPLLTPTLKALKEVKGDKSIWRYVSKRLTKSRSNMDVVNVGKLSKLTKDGDLVIVPGKVLGSGIVDHKIEVGALRFSQQALSKIRDAGGIAFDIQAFAKRHPRGKGVKLIGG